MAEVRELNPKEFRTMQLLELDMLIELDRVCRENNIQYCISCGTLLGAVRHKGYIPWDDDADIVMLREDYEKFRKVSSKLNPNICYFQDHYNDPEYLWEYGKLRRTNTSYIRAGQEHMKGKTGVFIDVFPLDDIPKSTVGQILNDFYCFFLRKTLYARVGVVNSKGISKMAYSCLNKISVEWVYKRVEAMASKSSNSSDNRVRLFLFTSFGKLYKKNSIKERYGMPKDWFLNRKEYEFEGYKFYGIADYDAFLKYMYGDYMKLPPVEKRQPHAPVSSFKFDVESECVRNILPKEFDN